MLICCLRNIYIHIETNIYIDIYVWTLLLLLLIRFQGAMWLIECYRYQSLCLSLCVQDDSNSLNASWDFFKQIQVDRDKTRVYAKTFLVSEECSTDP